MRKTIEVGVKVTLFTTQMGGVRCGHCGRRMSKGSLVAAPDVHWIGLHAICSGHKKCVLGAIRDAIRNKDNCAGKEQAREDLRGGMGHCLLLIRDMITTALGPRRPAP